MSICGEGAVGKTSLKNRFQNKGFRSEHLMTIGADFVSHKHEVDGNQTTFQLWDMAGQSQFKAVRPRFFRGSVAGLMVYDVTRPDTFKKLTNWIQELWNNNGRGYVPIIIVGNKADLRDKNSVSIETGEAYAKKITEMTEKKGFSVKHIETSAKTGLNVNDAFEQLARQIYEGLEKGTMKLD